MRNDPMWNEAKIEAEVRAIYSCIGKFPSATYLRDANRRDLANAINRHGGFLALSEKFGIPREHSDSDTGWDGEKAFMAKLEENGYSVVRSKEVKAPFDLLVDDVLRVDVNTARLATYGRQTAWYYRTGKVCQSDLIVFYQLDTGDFYSMPWWECGTTNIAFFPSGGTKIGYKNNWPLIARMIETRKIERRLNDAAKSVRLAA